MCKRDLYSTNGLAARVHAHNPDRGAGFQFSFDAEAGVADPLTILIYTVGAS